MFKKICIYQYESQNQLDPQLIQSLIENNVFQPCQPHEAKSIGFVPPRGDNENMVECLENEMIVSVKIEVKKVPAAHIAAFVKEKSVEFEKQNGLKPGKSFKKLMKDLAQEELIKNVLGNIKIVNVWIDRTNRRIGIDASNNDDVISKLVNTLPINIKCIPDLNVTAAFQSIIDDNSAWGQSFALGRNCTLIDQKIKSSSIKFSNHFLGTEITDEIKKHIQTGKKIKNLSFAYEPSAYQSVSFNLNDQFQFSQICAVNTDDSKDDKQDSFYVKTLLHIKSVSQMLAELLPIVQLPKSES